MGGRVRAAIALAAAATAGILAPQAHGASLGWVPTLPVAQQSWQQLSAFPDGTAFALDRSGNTGVTLWHSGDYGMTWDHNTALPPTHAPGMSVRFTSPTVGYAVDSDSLVRTTDGASTAAGWRPLPTPSLPGKDWMQGNVLGVAAHTISVGGERMHPMHSGCNPPVSENIWTSHDEGRHWVTARLPGNTSVSQIDYLDRRLGVAVVYDLHGDGGGCAGQTGDATSLFITRDGGRHFNRALRCGDADHGLCWTAKFLTASTLIAGRNNGGTIVSRDGGRTFAEGPALQFTADANTSLDSAFWVQSIDFTNQVGYATTKFAGTFRTTDLGRTWTQEHSCDSVYSLGIGEVAAFDGQRAIAGGPTCIAARVPAPGGAATAPVQPLPSAAGSGVDFVQRSAGRTLSVDDGVLRISWR